MEHDILIISKDNQNENAEENKAMIKVTRQTDPELAALVDEELNRQEHNIEMIASESTAPLAVM